MDINLIAEELLSEVMYSGVGEYTGMDNGIEIYVEYTAELHEEPMERDTGYRRMTIRFLQIDLAHCGTEDISGRLQDEIDRLIDIGYYF